jgi:hypothetical protein
MFCSTGREICNFAFRVVDQPRPRIPVVVVIRLEDVAEGIQRSYDCEVLTDDLTFVPSPSMRRGAFEIARPLPVLAPVPCVCR